MLMIGWTMVHKMFLTVQVSDGTAQQIGIFLLIGPIFILEIYFKHVTSSWPYVRAIVRPHNRVLRFYIKEMEEILGERYNTMRIEVAWPVKSYYHGKVNELKIIYEGRWNRRVKFRPGASRLYEYEVGHPQVEQVILYELLEGTLDYDHTREIPNYLLVNASGDYGEAMIMLDYYVEPENVETDFFNLEDLIELATKTEEVIPIE